MAVLSFSSPTLARVLRLTMTRRFGGKRKRSTMELFQVGAKRKRLARELLVGAKRKRLATELQPVLVGGKRKRLTRELLVGAKRKRLATELQLLGEKRNRLTTEQQPVLVGGKRRRLRTELSEEVIIDEILTRLPIKSVMRFKSVSKSWLSLLSDSQFIKKHNIRSPMQNPNDYDCFVANKHSHITILSRDEETFALCMNDYSLIGSVNGLVCLLYGVKRLSLWNPAIYQSMEFNCPQNKQGGYSFPTLVGVSFDSVSNDYKVVVFYDSCAAVYSSNSNLLIPLSVPNHEFPMKKFRKSSFIPTTYVKDCPYWTYPTYSSNDDEFNYSSYGTYPSVKNNFIKSLGALKFDATSNKFKLLTEFFPDARSHECEKTFRLVNMRDLLTLMAHERSTIGKLDVYSLDDEEGCGVWIKMYNVGPFEQFRRFRYLQQGFKYGDEIVFYEFGKIHYYDPKTNKFKCLPGENVSRLLNCFTYTPSMISLQGMKSIYSDDQTHSLDNPV